MARTVHRSVNVVEVAGILVRHVMMGDEMMGTCRPMASPYIVQPRAFIIPCSHTARTISQHPSNDPHRLPSNPDCLPTSAPIKHQ